MALYILLAVLFVILLVLSVFGGMWILDNKMPAFSGPVVIRVDEDDTVEDVIDRINSKFAPLHPASLARTIRLECNSEDLHPGSYHFKPTHTARYVARAITRGWQTPVRLTISGRILNVETLAGRIASQMMLDSLEALQGLKDSLLLSQFGTTPSRVFEIILPDTYEVYWDWPMEKILNRLKKEYDLYWNKERLALAQAQGLNPQQVMTLASIVSEETNKADEYPKIAAVYLNRLHKGIKLQACPTICYIYNYQIRRVLFRYLDNPSPYNTYKYVGLPPGPIALAGKEHIESVLHPDGHSYLYFCANADLSGYNHFSETLSEHEHYANLYRQMMDRRALEAKENADEQPVL